MKNINVGMVGNWGNNRGHTKSFVNYIKMLTMFNNSSEDVKYNIFIFNCTPMDQYTKDIQQYDDLVIVTDSSTGWDISEQEFYNWCEQNDLNHVLLNEFNQWSTVKFDIHIMLRQLDIKSHWIPVIEKFDKNLVREYAKYDNIICRSKTIERYMRANGLYNKSYIPEPIDTCVMMDILKSTIKQPVFQFLHVGGMGGVADRKNTQAVVQAYKQFANNNREKNQKTKLVITSQKEQLDEIPDNIVLPANADIQIIKQDLPEQELYKLIAESHVMVLPSRWESIGIPIIESLSLGVPVITTNFPPMNEFVINGITGVLVGVKEFKQIENINIVSAEVDIDDLAHKMSHMTYTNDIVYDMMCKKSIEYVQENLSMDMNIIRLIEVLK